MIMSRLQHTLRGAFAMALVAAALAGCGGSDNNPHPPPSAPAPAPPPVSAIDAFFAFVQSKIGSLSDTDEPVAIDSVAVTAPENTEPEALK